MIRFELDPKFVLVVVIAVLTVLAVGVGSSVAGIWQ